MKSPALMNQSITKLRVVNSQAVPTGFIPNRFAAYTPTRAGIGHYYTDKVSFGTTGSEFGLPVDIVALDYEWDIVVLTGLKYESSPTPLGAHSQKHYIFVAVPAGTGASIVTMFS